MLSLDDYWIWDSWIADDGERYHLFFLQAPSHRSSIRASGTRPHNRPRALDLTNWTYHGRARSGAGAEEGAVDDLALWTGSNGARRRRCLADVLHGDLQYRRRGACHERIGLGRIR